MAHIATTLAVNLKRLRKLRGWNQDQLAEAADLSRPYLARVETEATWVSPESVAKLAAALEVPESALFAEADVVPFEKYERESREWIEATAKLEKENAALRLALQSVLSDRDRDVIATLAPIDDSELPGFLEVVRAMVEAHPPTIARRKRQA